MESIAGLCHRYRERGGIRREKDKGNSDRERGGRGKRDRIRNRN
jgi:hypothetical protein